jgi:hypothetical protein
MGTEIPGLATRSASGVASAPRVLRPSTPGADATGLASLRPTARRIPIPFSLGRYLDFDRTHRARRTMIQVAMTRSPARPSPPFRNVSYSPGGQGTRRNHSAGALSPRGILARKWPGARPVFGKAPDGAAEKVRTEKGQGSNRLPPYLPRRWGRIDSIGPGSWIVLSFRPDFFSRNQGEGVGVVMNWSTVHWWRSAR